MCPRLRQSWNFYCQKCSGSGGHRVQPRSACHQRGQTLSFLLQYSYPIKPPMKYAVHFNAGNRRQVEEVYANSPREAQQVIESRNPNARVINVTGAR